MPTISLNNKEALLLINALDFYSRIWIGQYDRIGSATTSMSFAFGCRSTEKYLTEILLQVRDVIIPQLKGKRFNTSLGMWGPRTDDRAISAYDMQQVIHYARSWHLHPEGGSTRDFYTPLLKGSLPVIECACSGKDQEFDIEIIMHRENFGLILEALDVYSLMLECNISKLMEHYTDDAEALALAKQADSLYASIAPEIDVKGLAEIEALHNLMAKSEY